MVGQTSFTPTVRLRVGVWKDPETRLPVFLHSAGDICEYLRMHVAWDYGQWAWPPLSDPARLQLYVARLYLITRSMLLLNGRNRSLNCQGASSVP